jgi:1,3-beta-glucan synthase
MADNFVFGNSIVWLRPSKQIRAPVYTNKQRRQRRWIVIKYGIVYVLAIAIFAALIALRKFLLMLIALSVTHHDDTLAASLHNSVKINCAFCQQL